MGSASLAVTETAKPSLELGMAQLFKRAFHGDNVFSRVNIYSYCNIL